MSTCLRPLRRAASLLLAAASALALAACVSAPDGSYAPDGSSVPPSTVPSDAAGVLPAPGRTIDAAPPETGDLSGYSIGVVIPDDTEASQTLLDATRAFADASGAELEEFPADPAGDDPVGDALASAVAADTDLVVGLGDGVVGVFDVETSKILDQQVLVVGGQLAEPTENVTAVIWPGATSREPADDGSVTSQRGIDALGTGIESIRAGLTGVVLSLG